MSEYTATVTEFTERAKDHFNGIPARTLGGIVVKPPIHPGENFKGAILGQNSERWVDVKEVVTTDEATVFLAESGRGDVDSRKADIQAIADRIGQLANNPGSVVEMLDQTPFPGAREEW